MWAFSWCLNVNILLDASGKLLLMTPVLNKLTAWRNVGIIPMQEWDLCSRCVAHLLRQSSCVSADLKKVNTMKFCVWSCVSELLLQYLTPACKAHMGSNTAATVPNQNLAPCRGTWKPVLIRSAVSSWFSHNTHTRPELAEVSVWVLIVVGDVSHTQKDISPAVHKAKEKGGGWLFCILGGLPPLVGKLNIYILQLELLFSHFIFQNIDYTLPCCVECWWLSVCNGMHLFVGHRVKTPWATTW